MIKRLAAAALLLALGACSADPVQPATNKPSPSGPPPPAMPDDAIVCPADVRQCPDGSHVSRNPDNGCAFHPCPGEPPK